MARVVQDVRLNKREQRLRLPVQTKPHWLTINEGEHLGYYRGRRVSKWVARFRLPGGSANYVEHRLGEADDVSDADGELILDYRQAQAKAREWFLAMHRNGGRKAGPFTVADAMADYLESFQGKDTLNTLSRSRNFIIPMLGDREVATLTTCDIRDWLDDLAAAPARLRTAKGAKQNVRIAPETADTVRRRKSTANRIFTVLKAALNKAFMDGKTQSDEAWRRVKPFRNVEAPKLRYLKDDEARRLVNAIDPSMRPMVQAALLSGARYSELCRLTVADFDPQSRTLTLQETKAGKPRTVYLDDEGAALMARHCLGKHGRDLMFTRADGGAWKASQQARPMLAACEAAKLDKTGFHDLRRTYGARLALKGVPLTVIAEAMGHADERITRKHYAHLCDSYIAQTIRAGVSGQGIVAADNVVSLAG